MVDLKGTSWQQRYACSEIYTVKCKIKDEPAYFAKLTEIIANSGANINDIKMIKAEKQSLIWAVKLFMKSTDQLKNFIDSIKKADGLEMIEMIDEVLEMHKRGAIDVKSRLPIETLTDLRIVYTPGVAKACKEIEEKPATIWDVTGVCDRVAIATNGTAVLGLGDIGVKASLPVMEGKAAIFAEFVNVSAFPLLIETKDPDTFVETVVRTSDGFGAIQLEDVAAPACFEIEDKLRKKLDTPVFHDDQHGTATVVQAALINALKYTGKKPEECSVIMIGAGAAGYAISKILLEFGIGDIVVYDSAGALYKGRTEKMNPYKKHLAEITNKNNEKNDYKEGFKNKDIFIGVARPDMVSKDMIKSMNENPIALPLSNPVGEISVEEALQAGAAVAADGRGINNALAYPAIFRGALDAHAKEINLKMQLACAEKLAELAPEGDLLPDILDRNVHRQAADAVRDSYLKQADVS